MCVVAMMVPDDIRPEWPFGGLMAKHVDKLMAAHAMAHMLASASSGRDMITSLAEVSENLEELAREHDKAKQRGFYADLLDGAVWEPASVKLDEARHMVGTVGSLLDHGGALADPEFIAWLASTDPDALGAKDALWGAFFSGFQQGGPEGMFAALRSLMDETGATEGLPRMIREQAAIAPTGDAKRVQPRNLSRGQRRGGDLPRKMVLQDQRSVVGEKRPVTGWTVTRRFGILAVRCAHQLRPAPPSRLTPSSPSGHTAPSHSTAPISVQIRPANRQNPQVGEPSVAQTTETVTSQDSLRSCQGGRWRAPGRLRPAGQPYCLRSLAIAGPCLLAQLSDQQHEQRSAECCPPPAVFLDHLLGGVRLGQAGDHESRLLTSDPGNRERSHGTETEQA